MAAAADDMDENLENYKAQLKQVEAALLIDENNEDLQKLKLDLEEVITLAEELKQINEEAETVEEIAPVSITTPIVDKQKEWKPGDQVMALRQSDKMYHKATVDMIADDGISCTVKFDNSGSVDIVKVSSLRPVVEEETKIEASTATLTQSQKAGKLTREEIEKRREIKKKKLLKKKQRMKDFEEKRESEKNRWQTFFKKGTTKGKSKIKGINKKSIFASREDGKGKIGVGTCGSSGKGMTSYTPASAYMYKK